MPIILYITKFIVCFVLPFFLLYSFLFNLLIFYSYNSIFYSVFFNTVAFFSQLFIHYTGCWGGIVFQAYFSQCMLSITFPFRFLWSAVLGGVGVWGGCGEPVGGRAGRGLGSVTTSSFFTHINNGWG